MWWKLRFSLHFHYIISLHVVKIFTTFSLHVVKFSFSLHFHYIISLHVVKIFTTFSLHVMEILIFTTFSLHNFTTCSENSDFHYIISLHVVKIRRFTPHVVKIVVKFVVKIPSSAFQNRSNLSDV